MSFFKTIIPVALITAATSCFAADIRDTQDELITWVETQKAISETQAEWKAEKAIVQDLISLLENEKATITEKIDSLEDGADATDKKRSELNAKRDKLVASTDTLEAYIPKLEDQARTFLAMLPKPLLEEIDQLIRRLPEDSAKSTLPVSQRLLTVIGILNKIDKFNTSISLVSEIKTIDSSSVEVTTLYIGLAGAYFSDESGSYAGIGVPSADGWVWTEEPDISTDVVALIKSYQGKTEAKFVELPVNVL